MSAAFKTRVEKAKRRAVDALRAVGIEDRFMVRVKPLEGILGCYRYRSQFMERGPIFWISSDLPKLAKRDGVSDRLDDIIFDTILHEYGHVIYEFLSVMTKRGESLPIKALWEDVQAQATGPGFEEEFAEMMACVLGDGALDPVYYDFAKRYGDLVSPVEVESA